MLGLTIAGGVALILFGIRFLRKGLDRLLGFGLHGWLQRIGGKPWNAAGVGACFGTIAPSSTAQTLLTLQLLKTGRLAWPGALAFLLGANAGITVTVQLIALRVFEYYPVFLIAGLVGFQAFRSETVRGVGQSILGLGFILLAMEIMSEAARQLAAAPEFATAISLLASHPVMLVLFAAVFTLLAQSSTATLGLALALAGTGKASLELLVPLVLGANVGIGLTSLVAGYPTREGRSLAAANLVVKVLLVVLGLWFAEPLLKLLSLTPGDSSRQAANLHTAYNAMAVLLGVVFGGALGSVVPRLLSQGQVAEGAPRQAASHLDTGDLGMPIFALANATRETLRLAEEVKSMLERAWQAFRHPNVDLARAVQRQDDLVDELNSGIKQYLSRLPADAMTPRESHLQFGLLNFASQLEAIGDIVDKTLCGATTRQIEQPLPFAGEDTADVEQLYQRLIRRFDAAISVLATRDRELARRFLADSDGLKDECIEAQKRHYQRLGNAPQSQPLESSARYIDLVNALRRINGLLNTIGHTFVMEPRTESTRNSTQ